MQYVVRPGDTLWRIAEQSFGDPYRWRTIAEDNRLRNPHRLLVGQPLTLRDEFLRPRASGVGVSALQLPPSNSFEHLSSLVPGRAFLFVLADEIDPLRPKVVRKVMVSPAMAGQWSQQLGRSVPMVPNPEYFGMHPTDPHSPLSLGRHAMGMKPSPYSSASSHAMGSARISGSRFWIDVRAASQSGATFHSTDDIVADLQRIAQKTWKPQDLARIENIKNLVRADAEVAIKGAVPASAVKGAASIALTRGLQGVQIVGFVMTAVDVGTAVQKSTNQQSVKPIAAESIRQVGGWSMAWAGMKLGGLAGAALGIETGPGAVATAAIGAVAGGVAGYMGFDWIADHIDQN
jgi:hypothetical protein